MRRESRKVKKEYLKCSNADHRHNKQNDSARSKQHETTKIGSKFFNVTSSLNGTLGRRNYLKSVRVSLENRLRKTPTAVWETNSLLWASDLNFLNLRKPESLEIKSFQVQQTFQNCGSSSDI
uniref:uncharacterized protein LOC120348439 n=1 Tax=Styela clava TaxID=7725 RepID=UPI001939DFE4|nr:uncharacterized protein LOC120348439 [Styela clava]